jgi:hypothetical protein
VNILNWFQELLAMLRGSPSKPDNPPASPTSATRKVLVIIFAPRIPSRDNRPLYEVMPGWNRPDLLVEQLVAKMDEASYGYAKYTIVETIESPKFTMMLSHQTYTPEQYLTTYATHRPAIEDKADYAAILDEFKVLDRIKSGEIDEVWMLGYPYAGFLESRMGGPGAFFCNGYVLENTAAAGRRFIMMGFSYERGLGEMLEDMAHRAESLLNKVFEGKTGSSNLWERFQRIDATNPGQAEVGTVHHGPNAVIVPGGEDHLWMETRFVPSRHRTWYHFPDLEGSPEPTSCKAWQDPDMTLGHHMWWFKHFPHVAGQSYGISNNWWQYFVDPNTI